MIKRFMEWLGLEIKQDETKCKSCAQLEDILNYERLKHTEAIEYERSKNIEMLKALTELINPPKSEPVDTSNFKPILPRHMPFSARRAQLERESLARAENLKRSSPLAAKGDIVDLKMPITTMVDNPEVEALEQELGIGGE